MENLKVILCNNPRVANITNTQIETEERENLQLGCLRLKVFSSPIM